MSFVGSTCVVGSRCVVEPLTRVSGLLLADVAHNPRLSPGSQVPQVVQVSSQTLFAISDALQGFAFGVEADPPGVGRAD
jgi:hypothetical protein